MKRRTAKRKKTFKSEEKLMSIIYPRIAELSDVRAGLNVLTEILNHICMYGTIKQISIRAYRENKYADKYAVYLKKHGYARSRLGVYYPGKKLKELQTIPSDVLSTESEILMISDLLKNGYSDLVTRLNLQNVVPYARIANVYYLTALESPDLPRMSEYEVRTEMMQRYDLVQRRSKMKTVKHLRDLCEAGVLFTEDQKFYGRESILEEFSKLLDRA